MITGNWQEFDADGGAWDGLSGDDPLPLQQSWAYGEAMRGFGAQPLRLVCRRDSGVVASAQLIRNKLFGFLRPAVCFRGPLWHGLRPDDPAKSKMLAELKAKFPKRKFEVLLTMPEEASSKEVHRTMRRAGFRRIMTGYSTIWMDLAADEEKLRQNLDPKWRNKVTRAERSDIEVSVGGRKLHQYQWLLDREGEQRAAVRYAGLPTGLVEKFAEASEAVDQVGRASCAVGGVVSLTAIHDRSKVAGVLFLLHGNSATYFVGWNGDEGRKLAAHNLLLWRAVLELKERGIRWIDLGGINTTHGAGIARFKLSMGGQPITLAGTYA